MKEITPERLIESRRKAFQNACDLIRDAEILYEHQRWARCVFLSSIAIEELGKYLMIIGAIGQVLKNQVNWKRFWKRFREHTEKSGNILAFDVLLGSFISTDNTLRKLEKSSQRLQDLIEWGDDVRIAHQVFIVMEASLANQFNNNITVDLSIGVKGLEAKVGGSGSASGGTAVQISKGTCFAYLLVKIDWDAKQKKNKTKIVDLDDDQWSFS